MNDKKLRKAERLLKRAEFQRVFETRLSTGNKLLVLHTRKNDLGHPRLGLVVSKKFGNAVARNQFKRRIREFFRHQKQAIGGRDLVVLPSKRSESSSAGFEDLQKAFQKLVQKLAPPTS
ncbi:ribonuclease P protein component [Planctomycetota bacterium]|nr:ribonuclease P protein component [Planctomycetota bacterium]